MEGSVGLAELEACSGAFAAGAEAAKVTTSGALDFSGAIAVESISGAVAAGVLV